MEPVIKPEEVVTEARGVPVLARVLADKLMEHPDAPVIMMLPTENVVRGALFIGPGDGITDQQAEPDPNYPQGVWLVAIDLEIASLTPGAALTPEGVASGQA